MHLPVRCRSEARKKQQQSHHPGETRTRSAFCSAMARSIRQLFSRRACFLAIRSLDLFANWEELRCRPSSHGVSSHTGLPGSGNRSSGLDFANPHEVAEASVARPILAVGRDDGKFVDAGRRPYTERGRPWVSGITLAVADPVAVAQRRSHRALSGRSIIARLNAAYPDCAIRSASACVFSPILSSLRPPARPSEEAPIMVLRCGEREEGGGRPLRVPARVPESTLATAPCRYAAGASVERGGVPTSLQPCRRRRPAAVVLNRTGYLTRPHGLDSDTSPPPGGWSTARASACVNRVNGRVLHV